MDKWLDAISEADSSKEMLLTVIKEDAKKSRTIAYWSFSGILIPILGLIFSIYSFRLSSDVPNKGKLGKYKQTSKSIATTGLALSIASGVLWSAFVINNNHHRQLQAANAKYQSEVASLNNLNGQYQATFQSWKNLPSTITKTKADWDSYYSGLISELSGISSAQTQYSNAALSNYAAAIVTASNDFSSLLSLDQSSSDMQFQVQNDQSTITFDKGLVAEDEQLGSSYAVGPEGDLSTAEQQLSSDQQTLQSQTNQAKTLGSKLSTDNANLASAKSAVSN